MSATSNEVSVAWISRGRLFVKRADMPSREIESTFAMDSLRRQLRDSSLDAWKGRSGVWSKMGVQPPGLAPWESDEYRKRMRFVSVARGGAPDEIYYTLDMGNVGGLFLYNLSTNTERRLIHQQGFTPKNISRHPTDGELVFSLPRMDGTNGLHVSRHDGVLGRNIEQSDSLDEAPSWMPDGSKQIVFHSCMIARNEQGFPIGKSPSQIEKLDLKEGVTNTIHHDEVHDLIQPRILSDGSLVFIRRPYQPTPRNQVGIAERLWEVACIPYRILLTFFSIFSFLSMMFTGKPLITDMNTPASRKNIDPVLMLWGQAVDTQKVLNRKTANSTRTTIVPSDWKLIRRMPDGKESQLANSVATWDASPDGNIAWSDGLSVKIRDPNGNVKTIAEGDVIESFTLLC